MNKEHCIKSIKEFAQFEEDWDNYGGTPFNPILLNYACDVVKRMREDTPELSLNMAGGSVIPTSASTVQLEWRYNGKYLEIEITLRSIVWLRARERKLRNKGPKSIRETGIIGMESGEFFSNRTKKIDNLIEWLLTD